MRRVVPVLLTSAVVVAGLAAPAGAEEPGYGPDQYGEFAGVRNILPPGQSGSISVAEAAAAQAGSPPENFDNQLEMYDALNHADLSALTEGDLGNYYKDAPLTLSDADAVHVDRPKDGVTVRWDDFGVPYIEGATREDAAFGSGYAGTKDRMFLMDLLRHVGAARAAEFLGPSEANAAMDQEQLRAAYYSEEEAAAQIEQAAERFGEEGERLVAALDAYIEGINAAQQEMCPALVVGPDCPVEYAALGRVPEPWDRADVVFVASLVGGIFGKGGGAEFENARWLQQLEAQFGPEEARRVFDDLRLADDPQAPTTASTPAPYGGGPVDPTLPGVALPDLDGPTAPGTGADAGSGGVPIPGPAALQGRLGERPMVVDGPFGPIDLGRVPDGMSNAALMGADRTADGHPAVVFGPQTGYFAPQLLTEQAVVAPGIRARGVSFAGTSLVVQLGHGVDYAWSATSAGSDLVDTVVVRLCETDGGTATVESEAYLATASACRWTATCTRSWPRRRRPRPALPQQYRFLVLRTEHGIVQLRTTVDGAPVAVVTQRSTYGRELDSALGFERLGNPDYVQDAAGFRDAVAAIDYTFNWFYVDDRDIAYYSSGRLPLRAEGTDPHLPALGRRPVRLAGLARHRRPPAAGQPALGLPGLAGTTSRRPASARPTTSGATARCTAARRCPTGSTELAAQGGVTTVDMVAAVQDAATVDSRAVYTLPSLLDVIGDDPALADATGLLRGWAGPRCPPPRPGPRRRLRGAGRDRAVRRVVGADDGTGRPVAQELLAGTLGDLVADLPQRLDDHPRQGLGSSWNGVAWYGYVLKDLDRVRGDGPGRLVAGLLRRRRPRRPARTTSGRRCARRSTGCSPRRVSRRWTS